MFSNPQASQTRWGIAFGTLLAYALAFFLLYPLFGEGTAALAILPVAVIAWLGGTRVGVLAGLLSFPVNTLLLNLVEPRAFPWEIIFQSGGGPGSLTIVLIGLIVGILRDQRDWIAREL